MSSDNKNQTLLNIDEKGYQSLSAYYKHFSHLILLTTL